MTEWFIKIVVWTVIAGAAMIPAALAIILIVFAYVMAKTRFTSAASPPSR